MNEITFGRKKESGEDKCLTRMIQRAGWKTYYQQWILSISIFILWIIGRGIRTFPHLRRKPKDLMYLPFYIIVNSVSEFAKLYALVTIKEQKWIRAKSDRPNRHQKSLIS
ncbi:MAG: hypothetical protein WKF36_07430 [Candidatus Nitrosocosmicus sp.]